MARPVARPLTPNSCRNPHVEPVGCARAGDPAVRIERRVRSGERPRRRRLISPVVTGTAPFSWLAERPCARLERESSRSPVPRPGDREARGFRGARFAVISCESADSSTQRTHGRAARPRAHEEPALGQPSGIPPEAPTRPVARRDVVDHPAAVLRRRRRRRRATPPASDVTHRHLGIGWRRGQRNSLLDMRFLAPRAARRQRVAHSIICDDPAKPWARRPDVHRRHRAARTDPHGRPPSDRDRVLTFRRRCSCGFRTPEPKSPPFSTKRDERSHASVLRGGRRREALFGLRWPWEASIPPAHGFDCNAPGPVCLAVSRREDEPLGKRVGAGSNGDRLTACARLLTACPGPALTCRRSSSM